MRRTARRTAALALLSAAALAGCGGGADATDLPPAAAPQAAPAPARPVTAVDLGEVVRPSAGTPARVARALARGRVVVIGFVLSRPADDQASAHALERLRRRGPGASGVDQFVYRVDRTRAFGDLPELLGVERTPTVVVIGRDGRLRNRFAGWTDAAMLRQAVAEAKSSGDAASGADRSGDGPSGDRAGIALAGRVNARYASVAGVRMTGTAIDDRLGPADVAVDAALRRGRVSRWSGRFTAGGVGLEMAVDPQSFRVRTTGASCWAEVPATRSVIGVGEPMVPLDGYRVGAPRTVGGELRLTLTRGAGAEAVRGAYRIDRRSLRVIAVEDGAASVTVTDLPSAPAAAAESPPCAEPADALAGLPGAATP